MSATTQRTIRENVSISSQVWKMSHEEKTLQFTHHHFQHFVNQNSQLSEQLSEVTSENRRLTGTNTDLRFFKVIF